jgi:hypothetical protein
MATIDSYLWNVVGTYEPTAAQKEAASRSQNNLRDLLNTGQIANRITHSFLSGSYSRDTAIRPIDDVDIIFTIDASKWEAPVAGYAPNPEQVLDTFANAIRYRYPVSSIFGQRRSVRLQMFHLNIDVVPAIPHHQTADYLWIPDKEENKWLLSAPAIHSRLATQLNQRFGGKFKPLVKLLKACNSNLPPASQLRSFAIETICVRLFNSANLTSLQSGMLFFFDFIVRIGGAAPHFQWNNTLGMSFSWSDITIPDAAGTGTNVGERIDQGRRIAFLNECIRRRDNLLRIENAGSPSTALLMAREVVR